MLHESRIQLHCCCWPTALLSLRPTIDPILDISNSFDPIHFSVILNPPCHINFIRDNFILIYKRNIFYCCTSHRILENLADYCDISCFYTIEPNMTSLFLFFPLTVLGWPANLVLKISFLFHEKSAGNLVKMIITELNHLAGFE